MVDMVFFSKNSRGVCNHQYQNSLSALQNLLMCVISISYSFLLDVCDYIFYSSFYLGIIKASTNLMILNFLKQTDVLLN